MIGGLEVSVPGVTFLATEWVVDLGVAYQAIGHLRHGSCGDGIGLLQTPVARLAGIPGVEMPPDIARRLQIGLFVDRGRDYRRHVAHFQVLGMAEMHHPGGGRSRNLHILVAACARSLVRQQVVRRGRARRGRRVATRTRKLEGEVELVRKRRPRGDAAGGEQKKNPLQPL